MTKYIFNTTPERSNTMSKIKGKNTKPELIFRKALWASGIRYRLHVKKLPGSPDIVINKFKIVIFIDGDFWHGYNWENKKHKIKSNREYWLPKIERNMTRDIENSQKLSKMGYRVFRFWEHDIKKNLSKCIALILSSSDASSTK